MNDLQGIESIKIMVDYFYANVRRDDLLGPVFSAIIVGDWQPHLNKMYDFWNAALFGVPGFRGNPFAKHMPLPINSQHFIRWLKLFNQTVDRHFCGPVADDAKKRAEIMSILFQQKLQAANAPTKVIF